MKYLNCVGEICWLRTYHSRDLNPRALTHKLRGIYHYIVVLSDIPYLKCSDFISCLDFVLIYSVVKLKENENKRKRSAKISFKN